jgi:hypothetical protein
VYCAGSLRLDPIGFVGGVIAQHTDSVLLSALHSASTHKRGIWIEAPQYNWLFCVTKGLNVKDQRVQSHTYIEHVLCAKLCVTTRCLGCRKQAADEMAAAHLPGGTGEGLCESA